MLIDTEKYINEIQRQLSDGTVYTLLQGNPVWFIKADVNKVLKQAVEQETIDPKLRSYLTIDHSSTPLL